MREIMRFVFARWEKMSITLSSSGFKSNFGFQKIEKRVEHV